MKKIVLLLFVLSGLSFQTIAQEAVKDEDAFYIRKIYDTALTQGQCYPWLTYLTTKIGGRLSGSPQAAAAIQYTQRMLDTLGLDTVWLQPCMVTHWERGDKEQVRIVNSKQMGTVELNGVALGNSDGTGDKGITAEVIEVKSLDEVDELGRANIQGKIVFFNRPLNPLQIETGRAYGGAVDQRGFGPVRAAKYGAVGAIVRSMTTRLDDVPHTGATVFGSEYPSVPSMAISTNDAELLSRLLEDEPVRLFFRTTCKMYPKALSYNVIGEVYGSEKPEEIILVGGHLDSWDLGQGAHDDGAGCVQSMDVLQILKRMDYKPKRTLRCVLFMNEENGLGGGLAYEEASAKKGEFHMAAIESDAGGFTPRGFTADADASVFNKKFKQVVNWFPLLESYGLYLKKGGSGADINPLKNQKGLLFGLRPDSQRYFDYHHTAIDNIDAVNKRELELGAAAMTSLVYLLDKYGLE